MSVHISSRIAALGSAVPDVSNINDGKLHYHGNTPYTTINDQSTIE